MNQYWVDNILEEVDLKWIEIVRSQYCDPQYWSR